MPVTFGIAVIVVAFVVGMVCLFVGAILAMLAMVPEEK